jgi:hypothetical protein
LASQKDAIYAGRKRAGNQGKSASQVKRRMGSQPHDLAVSYNNRCYAEMKLGELKKALDDCTTSLKYDRIPDAFQKQQELLNLLGKAAT